MANASELQFWKLQDRLEKRRKKARSLTSVKVTSLPIWEEKKNLGTILHWQISKTVLKLSTSN